MDIKAAFMEPKTWVTVGSVVLILILGLGPLMTGLEGWEEIAVPPLFIWGMLALSGLMNWNMEDE